ARSLIKVGDSCLSALLGVFAFLSVRFLVKNSFENTLFKWVYFSCAPLERFNGLNPRFEACEMRIPA
ncbi:hypothetical protein, partial [Thermococcus sp. GR4]|uniref:hypothetical protein n=1 Tax=Thermococcus sp. GR4 TaxID=1638254 RepID=UPI00198069AE